MKKVLFLALISVLLVPVQAELANATTSNKAASKSSALRICSGAEKALLINLNGLWMTLMQEKTQLNKKFNGYLSDQDKYLTKMKINTLSIKILNTTDEIEDIEKSCNSKGTTKKIKRCTNREINRLSIWAEDFALQQDKLKFQWDKVVAAQNLVDQRTKLLETNKNKNIYNKLKSASNVKKQEFEALNADCSNSGVKLAADFTPGRAASDKAASDKAASDKAASDKAASDKAASDKAAGANIPKIGDCWNYAESEYESLSGNKKPVACNQVHTRVTYKIAFWPKTIEDPYELSAEGNLFSLGSAASVLCGSTARYEENLKSGRGFSAGTFFLPDKGSWDRGERWINCLEGLKVNGVYVPIQ
jgi:hypothetical protein